MAGPWEAYQEPKEDGPWKAFQPQADGATGDVPVKSSIETMLGNVPGSAANLATGMVQTASGAGWALANPDPRAKLTFLKNLAVGTYEGLKERYKGGLEEAMIKDPVGVAADAFTLAGIGGGAIKGARAAHEAIFKSANTGAITDEFNDAVTFPAAQRLENFAKTGDPNGVRLEPPLEKISQAAIMTKDGQIFTGHDHREAFEKTESAGYELANNDGFVTTNGRFVSRKEALEIANKTNQLKETSPVGLTSENFRMSDIRPETTVSGVPIKPPVYEGEPPPSVGMPHSVLAKTGVPEIDSILFDPTIRATIDNPVVDRSRTIPYEAGGSVPRNRATTYIDKHVPQTFTVPRLGEQSETVYAGFGERTGAGIPADKDVRYYTPNKKLAGQYGKNIEERKLNISNSGVYDVDELAKDPQFIQQMKQAHYEVATRNDELKARAATPEGKQAIENSWQNVLRKIAEPENDFGHARYDASITGAIIARARAEGKSVAIVRNMAEGHGQPSDQYIVLDHGAAAARPKMVTFDTAPFSVSHENIELEGIDIMMAGGMKSEPAYLVSHWMAKQAERSMYVNMDIDPDAAFAEWKKIQPGIQHEIANDAPKDLYTKEYPGADVTKARHEEIFQREPTPEEIQQGLQLIRDHYANKPQSAAPMLEEARQLGVIGMDAPENISLARLAEREKDTPAEAAFRAVPPQNLSAAATPKDMIGSLGHAPGSYDAKGKEWVSKIDSSESARTAIEQMAQSQDWYPESRAGAPSAASRGAVAEAAGIDPKDMDAGYFAEHFDNDAKVRAVIQALRQTTEDFTKASDLARREPNDINAAAQIEAEMRFNHVLEYTLGKRAESGRSLNTWKELLKDQEHGRAQVKLKDGEGTGEVPAGVSDVVDAARKVTTNLANPKEGEVGLKNLVDTARNLVDAQDKAPETRKALTDVAKKARAAAKEAATGKPTGLDALIAQAKELAKTLPEEPKEFGKPKPQGLASMINEAQKAVTATGAPGAVVKLTSLAEEAERLAMTMPKTAAEAAAKMPADIASLVTEARRTLSAVKGQRPSSVLDNLVAKAERDVTARANQPGRNSAGPPMLPPEWQELVDKADMVTKRFGGIAKGEEAAVLLARAGRTAAEQAEIARGVQGLTPNQVARVLEKLRDNKYAPHWTYAIIVQGLISGPVTHTFYPIINAMQSVVDRVLAPELAAITGRLAGQPKSLLAPLYGGVHLIRSFPDAAAGAVQAFKTGMRVPLESELRLADRGEPSPEATGAQTPYGNRGIQINWGTFKPENFWGRVLGMTPEKLDKAARVIGVPGRSANAQHTFFKFINEHADMAAQAFEKASNEARVGTDEFWTRYQYWHDNPTDAMLSHSTTAGYSGTFMDKLGERSQRMASLVKDTPAKWVVFFTHIPFKIVQGGVANSPVSMLHMLSQTRTGMALKGELGSDAAHLAWAHVALGTALSAYVMDKVLGGVATGDYPTDPKEQKRWRDLGIQPNSMQFAGQWWDMRRFGPIGISARIAANWAQVAQRFPKDMKDTSVGEAMMHAGFALSLGTANAIIGDAGFETVKGLVDVWEHPQKAAQFAAYHLGSIVQPISALSQGAAITDPYMREAHTLLQGVEARLPYLRETLPIKLDPIFGEPIPNPGYHTLLRGSPVNTDPVKMEMDRLNYFPGPPGKTVGGVKLTDEQYRRYESTAGPFAKRLLTDLVNDPNYQHSSPVSQIKQLKGRLEFARAGARQAMGGFYPELLQQGIDAQKAKAGIQ